jgi:hypothetical protein
MKWTHDRESEGQTMSSSRKVAATRALREKALAQISQARDVSAELEAVQAESGVTTIVRALNAWQRGKPSKGGRRMHPLRARWLLPQAQRMHEADPHMTIEELADVFRQLLSDHQYEDAVPAETLASNWDTDAARLLNDEGKALLRFLKRHL